MTFFTNWYLPGSPEHENIRYRKPQELIAAQHLTQEQGNQAAALITPFKSIINHSSCFIITITAVQADQNNKMPSTEGHVRKPGVS